MFSLAPSWQKFQNQQIESSFPLNYSAVHWFLFALITRMWWKTSHIPLKKKQLLATEMVGGLKIHLKGLRWWPLGDGRDLRYFVALSQDFLQISSYKDFGFTLRFNANKYHLGMCCVIIYSQFPSKQSCLIFPETGREAKHTQEVHGNWTSTLGPLQGPGHAGRWSGSRLWCRYHTRATYKSCSRGTIAILQLCDSEQTTPWVFLFSQ